MRDTPRRVDRRKKRNTGFHDLRNLPESPLRAGPGGNQVLGVPSNTIFQAPSSRRQYWRFLMRLERFEDS